MSQHTKSIMIQGTMSNAGKSILAAGLCRIFHQDGYRTAPFKSQNMALNSYITPEGLEMGRAQAVQAEAAGIVPNADMNPILLKPTTDVGSQVIVHGISRGNMKARDYFACKKSLVPDIMASYRRLEEQYDVIVIEGAGSPAEINLKTDDIVNMGMADMADAPVLLVGDIDRGGVFAQLYGTVALLTEEERKRIKGLIINKFRGDRSILEPGISMLEDLCGIPVVGVVPYMDVDIEDEDSLSSRLETGKGKAPAAVDLAVIRFPRISNFTDFNVFSGIPGVSLRYVTRACDLGTPDMVILPGTKNTIHDLLWMRQNGLEAAILKLADRRVPVWGICGGYQMMGEVLVDEKGVESDLPSRTSGMGLLPLKTEFEEEKIRTQVEGAFGQLDGCLGGLSGKSIEGYEIHMGRTYIDREEGAADTARIVSWRREPEICRPMDYVME
ncbi:MAG: cobyric acid synthase, partial [Enterocloster aldenensis]